MLLPTARNSHTLERTELLDRLRAAFPDLMKEHLAFTLPP
jgi:hypothetical protein